MLPLPFSLQSFANIREFNCLYIDKTKYAHDLIVQRQSFFLSRPRRFGKSVFISTLEEILRGNKALFKGLWIGESDYNWLIYGVIHLDFSCLKTANSLVLEESLCQILFNVAEDYEVTLPLESRDPNAILISLTRALYAKFGRVAILIDEYDHSILSTLHSPELETITRVVQSFFTTIKSLGKYVHFLFITGVTAFAKAGLFSGMSHPEDLSLLPDYSCICGYTEEEINRHFIPYLETMAEQKNMPLLDLRAEFKKMYNGYRFGENAPTVYNPFSFIRALRSGELDNFWFDSGTPSFLIELLKREYAKNKDHIFHIEEFRISKMEPKYFDVNAIPLPALMLQTGYLTIKSFADGISSLGFPNIEVQASLQRYILGILLKLDINEISTLSGDLFNAFSHEDIDKVTSILQTLYSHIPSILHIPKEKFYHSLVIIAFQACGLKTLAEYSTADGSIDLVLELPKTLYIIEIKFNKSAKNALHQIETKEYFRPFLQTEKTIHLLGLNFTRKTQKQAGKNSHFTITAESKLFTS